MREQLLRIKRGELQLFLPLIESSIGHVYAAAKRDLNEDKVDEAVQDVFVRLYNDIIKRYRWQNAERFLQKSLIRACSKKRIDFSVNGTIVPNVPASITRGILLSLSKSKKRKGKMGVVITAVVVLLSVFFLSQQMDSFVEEHASGTLYTASSGASVIKSQSMGGSFNVLPKSLINIYPLVDEGVALVFTQIDKYVCEIWIGGSKYYSIDLPIGSNFVGGSSEEGIIIFTDGQKFYTYDVNGKEVSVVNNPGYIINLSPNRRYVALTNDADQSLVYDILSEQTILQTDGEVLDIADNGKILFVDRENGNISPEFIEQTDLLDISINKEGFIVAVDTNSVAYCFSDNKLLWQQRLPLFEDKADYASVSRAVILLGPDIASFVVVSERGIIIQACSISDGTVLLDPEETDHTGYMAPHPLLSADGEYLIVASQISEYRYSVRYLGAINLTRSPMRQVRIPSSNQITLWAIETSEKGYYIYSYDSRRYLQVVFISHN